MIISNLFEFELHSLGPSIKGTKLLFQIMKAIIIIIVVKALTSMVGKVLVEISKILKSKRRNTDL